MLTLLQGQSCSLCEALCWRWGTTKGIKENSTAIGYHGSMSIHMPGYFLSIIKVVSTVMVSYSSWNGQKMHANRYLVKTVLKDTLKFRVLLS